MTKTQRSTVALMATMAVLALSPTAETAILTDRVSVSSFDGSIFPPEFPKPPNPSVGITINFDYAYPGRGPGDGVGFGVGFDVDESYRLLGGIHVVTQAGVALYPVEQDALVNSALALSATPFFMYVSDGRLHGSGVLQTQPNEPFILGVWGDVGVENSIPQLGDTFGWMRLQITTDRRLVLLGSAMETTGVGICAGTLTAAPEPSSIALAALGFAGLAWHLVRRKRAKLRAA